MLLHCMILISDDVECQDNEFQMGEILRILRNY